MTDVVEDDKDAALGRNRTLDVHPAESAAAKVATAAVVSNQGITVFTVSLEKLSLHNHFTSI